MRSLPSRSEATIRWISLALIVVSLLALARALPLSERARAAGEWIESLGAWAPVVYGLLYVTATVLLVPGSILTIVAGAIFGFWVAVFTVWLGATTGAMLAFLIARYVVRGKVQELARRYPKFGAVDRAVGEGGWRIVALLRLSPAVPFNLQNYLYGLTPIRFWPCLLATWVAILPGTFLYVYIGAVGGAAVSDRRERTVWEWVMLIVGLLATIAVTVYITVLARRKLKQQTELNHAEPNADGSSTGAATKGRSTWVTVAVAALAIVMATCAVVAHLKPFDAASSF